MTDNELKDLIIKAASDGDSMNALMEYYVPKIIDISRLYSGQGVLDEDLIGEGNLKLVEAISGFSKDMPDKDIEGEIVRSIMDAMEDLINEDLEFKKKDEKILDRVNEVALKAKELAEGYGRKITVSELMDESDLKEKTILDAIRLSGNNIEDIEYPQ